LILDLANPLPLEEIYDEETDKYVKSSHVSAKTEPPSTPQITKQVPITPLQITTAEPHTAAPDLAIVIPAKTIELRHYGTELLTREAGTAIRADMASYLAAGYTVRAVLDGVSDITPSVADEAFAKLAEILGHDDFESKIEIVGGSSIARRLIAFVLQTRRSRPVGS
jgi:hypothetical protein